MSKCACKAIIYEDFEDVYGPCGCGRTLATLPVLLPKEWAVLERPEKAESDEFCKGMDYRRISGFSCNNIFEHKEGDIEYLANYSCCRECAEKAVEEGYATWSGRPYPMALR